MKIKFIIGFIFYCTISFSQKTIVKINFEKQNDSLLYQYFRDDVYPMSQTLMDKKATDIGKYYGDTLSKYRNFRSGLGCVDFYGGSNKDSLLKYETNKGKVFLVLDVIKLVDFKGTKLYQNGMVYQKLNEKIKKGHRYKCSLYYSLNIEHSNIRMNGFGFLFTKYKDKLNTNEYILQKPQVYTKDLLKYEKNKWQQLEGEFIAEDDFDTIIVGFFEPKDSYYYEITDYKISENSELSIVNGLRLRIDDIVVQELD